MTNHQRLRSKLAAAMPLRQLGLYIHIPFCERKCEYCDFLSAPATDEQKSIYLEALVTELESNEYRCKDYIISTIFLGGGTPSCLDAKQIRRIMDTIHQFFRIDYSRLEATIEVNPGTVTEEKLKTYLEAGINRLSFGLQSVNNRELQQLGRIHTYEQFLQNYQLARKLGYTNINIDLMSALPEQTLQSWDNTLHTILALEPEHISAYSLMIEEGTKFYDRYREGAEDYKKLPDEDTDRNIYHRTKEVLENNGYYRYEISNYARKGHECRHNRSYWTGTDYLGVGLGASSLINGVRFNNITDLSEYIRRCEEYKDSIKVNKEDSYLNIDRKDPIGIVNEYTELTLKERMEEAMFLGLRMCEGVSKASFYNKFDQHMEAVYGNVIRDLVQKGLLENQEDDIKLTNYGIDISNSVLSMFLLDEEY